MNVGVVHSTEICPSFFYAVHPGSTLSAQNALHTYLNSGEHKRLIRLSKIASSRLKHLSLLTNARVLRFVEMQ